MISKELFETVIGFRVIEFEAHYNDILFCPESHPRYRHPNWRPDLIAIDIYELAHKCKEWALKQGYDIYSSVNGIAETYLSDGNFESLGANIADTEPEAIFKACQWILDQSQGNKP